LFPFFASFAFGLLVKAVRQLDTALSIEPSFARLHVKRGQLSIALGEDASAIERFRRALNFDKNLPSRILKKHDDRIEGTDRVVLWRMRD
jgi:lipopolysaccharide biosynthesis regulator YciM